MRQFIVVERSGMPVHNDPLYRTIPMTGCTYNETELLKWAGSIGQSTRDVSGLSVPIGNSVVSEISVDDVPKRIATYGWILLELLGCPDSAGT